jgi:hypothetical protein
MGMAGQTPLGFATGLRRGTEQVRRHCPGSKSAAGLSAAFQCEKKGRLYASRARSTPDCAGAQHARDQGACVDGVWTTEQRPAAVSPPLVETSGSVALQRVSFAPKIYEPPAFYPPPRSLNGDACLRYTTPTQICEVQTTSAPQNCLPDIWGTRILHSSVVRPLGCMINT